MEMTEGQQLLQLSGGRPRTDGRAIAFCVERKDGEQLDVWCEVEQIADIVRFLSSIAAAASEQPDSQPQVPSLAYHVALPALGMGLAPGPTPGQTDLVVTVPGFQFRFQIPSSEIARLANDFGRIAATVQADTTTRQ